MAAVELDKQALCCDILVNGHVQAFVDFFYLTHRPEAVGAGAPTPGGDGRADDHLNVPAAKLPYIQQRLTEAEVGRRQGDTRGVFSSYKQLAFLFSDDIGDHRTAVYFWEKCAEIARLTNDAECEVEATRALGIAHEALGDVRLALTFYQKLQRLTSDAQAEDDEKQAWVLLHNANVWLAEAATAAGELREALELRQTCLQTAQAAGDKSMIGKAHYEMGQAHERLRDIDELLKAITHYKPYLSLCEESGDEVGQGTACFALAQAYQRLDDTSQSQTYLRRFLEAATASGKLAMQAEACCSLGVLYNAQADHKRAVEYLDRFFDLARQLGDKTMLDKARTYLGIARGNAMLPAYQRVVTTDLDALLAWKNRRVPFVAA